MINILKHNLNNLNELKDIIISKFKEKDNDINKILNEYIDKKLKEEENIKENNKKEKLNKNKTKMNY